VGERARRLARRPGIPLPDLAGLADDPIALPAAVVTVGTGGVDSVQAAAHAVAPGLVGPLPERVRTPIAQVKGRFDDAVDGLQDAASGTGGSADSPLRLTCRTDVRPRRVRGLPQAAR